MIIAIDWAPNSITGWGLYALNLVLAFSGDDDVELIYPHGEAWIDPLRAAAMNAVAAASAGKIADVFVHNLGNELMPEPETPIERTVGVIFFEEPLSPAAVERAKRYPLILAGSEWNTRLLNEAGATAVTVHQGVDRSLFHPAQRIFKGRFPVFSGGKAEWRKGQDLVLKAFSAFASHHDDAVLVTAWHSPWPRLAAAIGAPLKDGNIDVYAWAKAHGIAEHQILDLGIVHNPMMPQVYREMACAVFPNRAEGGTNQVALECIASAVPTLVSRNTGHLDLNGCRGLEQQSLDDMGRGETAVDEIVGKLERCYAQAWGGGILDGFSWSMTAAGVKAACVSCLSQTAIHDDIARPGDCFRGSESAADVPTAAE